MQQKIKSLSQGRTLNQGKTFTFKYKPPAPSHLLSHLQKAKNVVDDVESPIMPAKNQFVVNLIIERIEKGRPSLCGEVEL